MQEDPNDPRTWQIVDKSRKAKNPPVIPAPPVNAPGEPAPTASYDTKIRVILNNKGNNLQVGIEVKLLLEYMMNNDPGFINFSSINDSRRIMHTMDQYPDETNAFMDFFDTKTVNKTDGTTSVTIYFNMKSNTQHALNTLKSNTKFIKTLKQKAIYTFEHPFKGQRIDRPGFFSGISDTMTHLNNFQRRLNITLEQSTIGTNLTVPLFAINPNYTKYTARNDDGTVDYHTTHALEIECEPADHATLVKMISEANLEPAKFGTFVPFETLRTDPEVLLQHIATQNCFRANHVPIYINGCHPEVMHGSVTDDNKSLFMILQDGTIPVLAVEETSFTTNTGTWALIVHKNNIIEVRDYINSHLLPTISLSQTYLDKFNHNESYQQGITVNRFPRPSGSIPAHIQHLRTNTTFYTPEENRPFQRHFATRPPPTHAASINFSTDTRNFPPASTNAWTTPAQSMATIQPGYVTNPPARNNTPSTESDNASTGTDATTISQILAGMESITERVSTLSTTVTLLANRTNRLEHREKDPEIQAMRIEIQSVLRMVALLTTKVSAQQTSTPPPIIHVPTQPQTDNQPNHDTHTTLAPTHTKPTMITTATPTPTLKPTPNQTITASNNVLPTNNKSTTDEEPEPTAKQSTSEIRIQSTTTADESKPAAKITPTITILHNNTTTATDPKPETKRTTNEIPTTGDVQPQIPDSITIEASTEVDTKPAAKEKPSVALNSTLYKAIDKASGRTKSTSPTTPNPAMLIPLAFARAPSKFSGGKSANPTLRTKRKKSISPIKSMSPSLSTIIDSDTEDRDSPSDWEDDSDRSAPSTPKEKRTDRKKSPVKPSCQSVTYVESSTDDDSQSHDLLASTDAFIPPSKLFDDMDSSSSSASSETTTHCPDATDDASDADGHSL